MASSSVTYTSGTNNFNITFPYLRDKHVVVLVGGTLYDVDDNYFTIDASSSTKKVVLTNPLSEGTTIKILRMSLGKNNDLYNDDNLGTLVDFVDGSVLTEKQQDESYLHNYYLNQESLEGNLKLGTPILDSDPATKGYVDGIGISGGGGSVTSVTAGNGLSGGTITTSGTVSIPTSGGDLNINSGKVGIGGDADGTYKAKVTGDLLVSESSDHTVLTVENTNTSGANNSTLLITAPQNATIQLKDTDTTSANTGIYNITSANGFFNVGHISDDGLTGTPLLSLYPTGNVKIDQLPTSDPSTAGYLWNNGGVVAVSGSSGFSGNVSKYDSGWVATDGSTSVANGATLTFTHGLNTSALTYVLYAATDSSGSNSIAVTLHPLGGATSSSVTHGAQIQDITSTTLKAQLGTNGYVKLESDGSMDDTSGTNYNVTFTYVRLVAIG